MMLSEAFLERRKCFLGALLEPNILRGTLPENVCVCGGEAKVCNERQDAYLERQER